MLELHPLCTLFPRMAGAEFESLKADILAHGLREPITVHEGMILDGGNRYRACLEAGVEPLLRNFAGGNPASYVLSVNLHRRHLSPGQQAAIVASAQDWSNAQPAHRPEKGGNVAGLSTVADRAAKSGASERTQRMADSVARQSPDLARQVAHGEISLPRAIEKLAPAPAATPHIASHDSVDAPHFGVDESAIRSGPAGEVGDAAAAVGFEDDEQLTIDEQLAVELAEVERLTGEVATLSKRVALLEQGGSADQLLSLERDRDGYRNSSTDHFNKWAAANKKVIGYEKLLDKMRKIAGVEKYSDLVTRITPAPRSE